uniref:Beta-xylanase (EC) n=1 Tax=Ganoderma boninense TaxID=34458 RepID=A0A5K1JTW2_9APHY|nr:Beta-xylanase (EC [Ganoderma boninense]
MTIGVILPPLATPPSDEYIVQMVVPVSYGWSGISMGGQMTNSLLVPFWPNGDEIVLGPRWADDYVLPTAYAGPEITLLPPATVNSTHVNAIFRCQNCTVWDGGSLGSGDLNGTAVFAYVASTMTGVDDPSDVNSSFMEHDYFNFFGMDLSAAHSSLYTQYVSGGASSTTAPPAPSSTPATPSSTSSAPAATQTECGGTGWTGPTVCASGLTCVAVSPPYYNSDDNLQTIYTKLTQKAFAELHGKPVRAGYVKYEWNNSFYNLDDGMSMSSFCDG